MVGGSLIPQISTIQEKWRMTIIIVIMLLYENFVNYYINQNNNYEKSSFEMSLLIQLLVPQFYAPYTGMHYIYQYKN